MDVNHNVYSKDHEILFHNRSSLKIGEIERYIITYDLYEGETLPSDLTLDSLWIKIKNVEALSYRAAYLMGPYSLYFDVRTHAYHHSQTIYASVDRPQFASNLQAQQHRIAELSLHRIQKKYVWTIDIVSQVLFSTNTNVTYEITVSNSEQCLKINDSSDLIPSMDSFCSRMHVSKITTADIWKLPPQLIPSKKKKHLVVLTHGLHSNVSADMAYIQEQIYKIQSPEDEEQYVVDGYTKNVCETEKGIKYLGRRVAEYIIDKLYDDSVCKISFIGHSLGGLVQAFAVVYLGAKYPWFFQKVEPINFITLASPLLGIVTDNPAYIKILLSLGVIGKTGQDLGLQSNDPHELPLLYLLSGEPLNTILSHFRRRTVYSNAVNDGVVPLYSSSLLFLNYEDTLKKMHEIENMVPENVLIPHNIPTLQQTTSSSFDKFWKILNPNNILQTPETIPKVSLFETASSILLPPDPDMTYITKPNSRYFVIVHDKLYSQEDIPQEDSNDDANLMESNNVLLQAFSMGNERKRYQKLEELIARRWHKGIIWRKVVVALKPDAHNNIIVRRRFTNAYGWPVIDHLIENHFMLEDSTEPHHEEFDIQDVLDRHDLSWIFNINESSIFDQGPTGMISTVNDMFDTISKRTLANLSNVIEENELNPEDDVVRYEEKNSDLYG
ncbi:similar to Saccharomyces cerevisiae YGL144C ROG1 Protein with putative serine active lipase domain [Maudiozyma saulgeensis]|uniref:Similar to Saccharomyces cerevisiae YGL144C ROG1 Protein with putative serine active lipase domain n=1 Tax=Maudiozyma saulgeensis TaxID=1789683 RepID=A0A1X7R0J7_9SACH|nr:similar to Saccharomyces cerevisiae YGL144C ROG1 Protein with putative serine active lipase domain [Kazachstania saulgeensis]